MQRALEQEASAIDGYDNSFGSVVSDLLSLIGHVQASMALIEAAIARESPADNGSDDEDVVVLDDITPRFAEAGAALIACNVSLSTALQSLLDASNQLLASKRREA